jgi:S1-C subfamily serine protease
MESASFASPVAPVNVVIKVAVVDIDLSLKPVPKHPFEILPLAEAGGDKVAITTSFTGEGQVQLGPGHYRIRSMAPVQLGLRRMEWDFAFEVISGRAVTIELSNDNALIGTPSVPVPVRPKSTATEVFQALRDSVVTVESEGGHGSGFLVDERGLLITNEHVTSGSRFFTVSFDDEHRLPATVIASDAREDVAILVINPKAMPPLGVIRLAADSAEQPPVREGDEIFAIGSPLHQQKIITAGIVSKVETGAIISDVMIDHGNSGGPLLNAEKEAIGINTFGEGRGISGTVRIWKAFPVLEEARKKLSGFTLPSSDFRPPIPRTRYPADALKQIVLAEDFDLENYHIVTRRFDVFLLTPPALCYFDHQDDIKAAQGRQQRRKKVSAADTYDPVADIKGWAQYVGQYSAIVKIVIIPRIKPTFGSAFAAGLVGSSAVMRYRYQGDVDTLRLIRDGKEVQPIRIGRAPVGQRFAGPAGHMEDVAYLGFAEFLPEAFEPARAEGDHLGLEILNEAKPDAITSEEIGGDLLQRIWRDFAPLRAPASR